MSWSIGFDSRWNRDIGYGVPARCDHPGCTAEIDRGLGYVCGSEPYGGDHGCGLYFCGKHLSGAHRRHVNLCERCKDGGEPFDPSPDSEAWIWHKLTDPSWARWRGENPAEVAKLKKAVPALIEETLCTVFLNTTLNRAQLEAVTKASDTIVELKKLLLQGLDVVSRDGCEWTGKAWHDKEAWKMEASLAARTKEAA